MLLAVIGPRWLTATDPAGRRRIDDPADWIRRELATAFAAGVRVIPVLTEQADLPTTAELPADIAALSRCQFRRLRYREPTADLARLVTDLISAEPVLASAARSRDRLTRAGSVPAAMFSMRGDLPEFVGRHDELRTLLDTVVAASQPVRGIAVHAVDGMPGVGKTVFSIHAAHRLADRFPDGQIFLELHGHSPTQAPRSPSDALASLLVATGIQQSALPHELDDRARLWRDRITGKKVLLVLDDAASHDQLRPLLPGTPDCFVVITSRHRLQALDGVHTLPLDVMPSDQATRLLLRLADRTATSTHADPATATPAPDAESGAAARVQLCGYLPLAIALAAGRLRSHPTWSITYLADLLDQAPDRLEHLAGGDRSIQAAFTVSYQHLAPQRQRILALLGAHPGPSIDAYALAALADCSLTQAHQHLEALHTDCLIQETAPGRYQLHDLLRVYAGSLAATADQADTEQAMRRVLDYYLHTAATADAHMTVWTTPTLTITLHTPAHHPDVDTRQRARAWLDTELATLATCLDHATGHPDLAIALSTTLHNYLRISGAYELALHIHHTALAAAERTQDRLGQATTLTYLGRVYYLRGDWERAQQRHAHALQLFTDLNDQRGQANTLSDLGGVLLLPGKYERAQEVLDHALQLFADLGDQRGQANTLALLGRVYYLRGEYERAQEVLDHALQLLADLGDQRGQANTLHFLGHLFYLRGDWERAQHVLDQAHNLWIDFGSPRGQAQTSHGLGRVRHQQGDYDQALDLLTQAQALYAATGQRDGQADALNSLGDLALDHPSTGDPYALFTQAHTLARTIGTALHEAHALAGLGRCAHRVHDVPTATTAFTQALAIYQRIGSPEAATITRYLADLHTIDQHPEPT